MRKKTVILKRIICFILALGRFGSCCPPDIEEIVVILHSLKILSKKLKTF